MSPFVKHAEGEQTDLPSIDHSTTCATYEETGTCNHGFKCRFLGAHVRKGENDIYELVNDAEKQAQNALTNTELNFIDAESRKLLQRRKVTPIPVFFEKISLTTFQYPRPITDAYLAELQGSSQQHNNKADDEEQEQEGDPQPIIIDVNDMEDEAQNDTPDVPMRAEEKKRLNWAGKTCEIWRCFDHYRI